MDWYGMISQLAGVVIGGLFVILANELAEKRRRTSAAEQLRQHERAVYTAIFAIRNFIAEELERSESRSEHTFDIGALSAAQQHLHRLIEKSQPDSQTLLITVFEVSLRLDDLLSAFDLFKTDADFDQNQVHRKLMALLGAVDQFDIISGSSLDFLDDDYVNDMIEKSKIYENKGV